MSFISKHQRTRPIEGNIPVAWDALYAIQTGTFNNYLINDKWSCQNCKIGNYIIKFKVKAKTELVPFKSVFTLCTEEVHMIFKL